MPVEPLPCGSGAGGDAGADVEQTLLCDILPDGEIAGTALAVYEYDSEGNPAGPPTFVDPATGNPYVAQGILQPCPGDVGCAPPTQFCFTSTSTGPVEHPGRIYDISLPINPGFAVDSLQIDATNYPANITWAVTDPDGEQFRPALQSFLDARFPGLTVTVTNPNAGTPVCGQALPMTIHIECARIDAPAPNLVELIYNGGRDLVVNPAYLTTPPTNLNGPQFVYLRRQDAGGTLNCTSVANQGWETNDLGDGARDFELWGTGPGGLQTLEGATPTPRGTPIQEITADINDTGTGPTIWQTFTVPAAGVFKAVMVHGARDNGETHRITLSTGDTNDNQVGDLINNVTNPPQVTNVGGNQPGPWTTFSQDIALGAGTYTFAISTTNPVGANRGGLFTDMRVYVDAPDQHAAAVTDDETCTVTTEETVTTTTCEYWQPRCANGEITHWVNVADGEELTNAAFWGQAPAPSCCLPEGGDGGGGSVSAGNLIHNYEVCGIVGGIAQTLQRVVITDQSGGVQAQTFVGADGGPVTPSSYTVGACNTGTPVVGEFILCDDNGPFVRKLIQSPTGLVTAVVNVTLAGVPYVPVGTVQTCGDCPLVLGEVCVTSPDFPGTVLPATAVQGCDGTMEYLNANTGEPWPNTTGVVICPPDNQTWEEILCDQGNDGQPFRRVYNLTALGSVVFYDENLDATPYAPVGPVGNCASSGLVLGERCYSIPEDGPLFTGGLGTAGASNVTGNPFHAEYANWQGSGVDVTVDSTGPGGHINTTHTQWNPAGSQPVTITFSEPVALSSITVGELDNQNQEFIEQFSHPVTGLTGSLFFFGVPFPDTVASNVANANPDGDIQFGGVQTTSLSFSVRDNGLGQWLQGLSFNTLVSGGQGRAAVVRCQGCEEGSDLVYIDLATGLALDPDTTAWVECTETVTVVNPTEFADTEVLTLCDDGTDPVTPFLRRLTFDGTGALTGTVDTDLDGAPYVVVGDAVTCAGCTSCQTLTLCDFGADEPVLITGISTGGTLSNGITWSGARGSSTNFNPQHDNADGSWWGMPSFPNATVAPDTWFFDRPVDVEFSVVIAHSPATGSGAINQVQVPIGSELISSAPDYSYDVATGIVTVDASNTGDCTKVTNPTVANSARFVLRNVTQFTLDFLGQRIAICGQFSNWRFGSIAVTPATSTFLRTICRDCDGVVTSVIDTQADGTTPYTPIGPVGECGTAADAEPQCFATQICVQPQGVEEFISNEANLTSTVAAPNVDPVWKWSNDPVAGPWFDMYDVGVFPGWFTVDPGTTEGVANWVAPHPNSSPNTSGLAGEGPTIGPGNAEWYARAQFTLPANADPASIRIAATVINADQLGVEFRLNTGAWQPVNASHVDPPFSFPAQVIPGAQAGLNEVFVHVRETVFGSGAAGVKMHLIASYNLGDPQSWTQIVCDDGTVSYFTNAGEQTDALPEDWVIVPCGAASGDSPVRDSESFVLCSSTPTPGTQFIRNRVYNEAGAVVTTVDTTLAGAPFVPGVVSVCTQAVATDFDFVVQTLCDSNGTAFFRRLTFNSATGAVTSTTDTTLAGAAFVPVGAVGLCSNCCPSVIGNGCTNVGSGFYTAIRATNGTISLIDSVTGAAVAAVNVVPCPSDNTVRTLTAQARLVGDADAPWTPGADVVGTLTSVTMTVLSGTATLTDQNGTVLAGLPAGFTATWSAEDDNTLSGPTSIDAIGGSTVVHWTQR